MTFREVFLQEENIDIKKLKSDLEIAIIAYRDSLHDARRKHLDSYRVRLIKAYKSCNDKELKDELKDILDAYDKFGSFISNFEADLYRLKDETFD